MCLCYTNYYSRRTIKNNIQEYNVEYTLIYACLNINNVGLANYI